MPKPVAVCGVFMKFATVAMLVIFRAFLNVPMKVVEASKLIAYSVHFAIT